MNAARREDGAGNAPAGNAWDLFQRCFPADPGRPFLETAAGAVLSWRDALWWSARYANLFRSYGLEPGDRVAVQAEKSPQVLFLYFACLRAGSVLLPLNTAYREEELRYFIEDARPQVVVADPGRLPLLRSLGAPLGVRRFLSLDAAGAGTLAEEAAPQGEHYRSHDAAPDDVAAILYTSGTTGRPKGGMVTHRNLWSNARALRAAWGFTASDVLLHALPVFHAHGLFTATNCVLASGARMLFLPRFDGKAVCRLLPRATVMTGAPTFYTRLLREPAFDRDACKGMRLLISGSAPLLADTFEGVRERTGHAVLERYGTTEAMIITSNPLRGERRAGTVGLPLPGVEVRIAAEGDDGTTVPARAAGRLQVRGPNVFRGYWRLPEKTADAFTEDGYFRTGDLASRDDDGYITLVGRESDLIISGGYNVYPKEVEGVIDRLPRVEESSVIGVPHPDFGEAVVAVVRLRDGARDPVDEQTVIDFVKDRLAGYKAPKRVVFVPALPRNSMGKIQKNLLRETWRDLFA